MWVRHYLFSHKCFDHSLCAGINEQGCGGAWEIHPYFHSLMHPVLQTHSLFASEEGFFYSITPYELDETLNIARLLDEPWVRLPRLATLAANFIAHQEASQ